MRKSHRVAHLLLSIGKHLIIHPKSSQVLHRIRIHNSIPRLQKQLESIRTPCFCILLRESRINFHIIRFPSKFDQLFE